MAQTSVSQFASELKMPATALLEQLTKAGVGKKGETELLSDADKTKLLDYLRKSHGDTVPQAVDTAGLPDLPDEVGTENPWREATGDSGTTGIGSAAD